MITRTFIGSRGGNRATVKCGYCSKEFNVPTWKFKTGRGKYCSRSCRSNVSGVENYRKLRPEQKQKLAKLSSARLKKTRQAQAHSETLQPHWSGDRVGYHGLHIWIRKNFGRPKYCEMCHCQDGNRKYEWANISGQYRRDRSDFIRLCIPCHRRRDDWYKKMWATRQRNGNVKWKKHEV